MPNGDIGWRRRTRLGLTEVVSSTAPHLAQPRIVTTTEHDEAFVRAYSRGFYEPYRPEIFELDAPLVQPDRMFGHQVDGRWVSTCGSFPRVLTTPGGSVPVGAVTVVTVSPGYRRRGLLREMMAHQLADLRRRDEPVALLWASESLIYGRFGYGRTTSRLSLSGRTRATGYLPGVDVGTGSCGEVEQADYLTTAKALHEAWLPDRPGALSRNETWWSYTVYDAEHIRHGAGERRYVLHFDADGTPDGYAGFRVKEESEITDEGGEVIIGELDAADPRAYASLWRWLLDLDLVRAFSRRHAPTDEPLRQLVADQRAVKSELADATYARILDVERALSARRYAADLDVVIELADPFLPDLAGRYRLQLGPDGAEVSRTDAGADLALTATQLGAIYLGGTPLTDLHRAGLVTELTAGSVLATSAAFAAPRAPWCPDFF